MLLHPIASPEAFRCYAEVRKSEDTQEESETKLVHSSLFGEKSEFEKHDRVFIAQLTPDAYAGLWYPSDDNLKEERFRAKFFESFQPLGLFLQAFGETLKEKTKNNSKIPHPPPPFGTDDDPSLLDYTEDFCEIGLWEREGSYFYPFPPQKETFELDFLEEIEVQRYPQEDWLINVEEDEKKTLRC